MKASEKVLQHLLDGKTQYCVPLFQRTYNWVEKDWSRLWDDLLEIYAMDEPRNHFIGAVVTQPIAAPAGSLTKYLLIDGQQRLTTLFIILACICKSASQTEGLGKLADEIKETCLVNKFASDSEDRFKLRPTQKDRHAFRDALNGETPTQIGQVAAAFKYFSSKLAEGDSDEQPLGLRKLKSCITDHLDLVSITLETDDSPHRIFESLNNTGMPLGSSDLIRNHMFMRIPKENEAQEAYDRYWFPMQEATAVFEPEARNGTKRFDDFFWYYLMMDGSLPKQDQTFQEIKKRFGAGDADQAIKMLIDFSTFARYYRWLCDIGEDKPEDLLLRQIKRLNTWEVSVAYPFLMKSLGWIDSGGINSNQLVNVMKMIESFVVRRAVCNVPTNRLRSIFGRMSVQVERSAFDDSSSAYLLDNRWPNDEEFELAFVGYTLYSPARLSRTRLILDSLEDSFENKEPPKITDRITIEHVMPQTMTSAWEEMLGPRAGDIHSQWLHTPGNLTLTGYNPELGNSPFYEKKATLQDTHFSLTHSILACDRWDEGAIRSRGEELAKKALQIWSRPLRGVSGPLA